MMNLQTVLISRIFFPKKAVLVFQFFFPPENNYRIFPESFVFINLIFQWNYTDFFPFLAYSGVAWRNFGWFLGIFRNSGLAMDNRATAGHEIILKRDFSEGFSWNFLLLLIFYNFLI